MAELLKNELHTVTIDGYTSSGDGVARIDGMAVFVRGALAGEECIIKILKAAKTYAFAKVENILTPSPHRVTPPCPCFGKCGGCSLMHMDYAEELRFKKTFVNDAFARIGGLELSIPQVVPSPETEGYRNKNIYAVCERDGEVCTGFFREHSHDVVPVERCMLQPEITDKIAAAVRAWMKEYKIPVYDEKTHRGAVRHIFCRAAMGTGQAQLTVVSAVSKLPHLRELADAVTGACPEVKSIVLNVNKTVGNTVLAGGFRAIWGDDRIEDTLCGMTVSVLPRSFYQINRRQAENLYAKTVEYAGLTGTETVLDLYCGTGTITLCLAKNAGRAIGAEIVLDAVEDARKNALRNRIMNAEFICADAAQAAEKLKNDGVRLDVVTVDPPRKGLSAQVIDTIAEMGPQRVVYVSCDPATLSRDLKLFEQRGYRAQKAEAFDMFPRCTHVETVVLMSKVR